MDPWDNFWERRPQSPQLIIHHKVTTTGRRITCNRHHIRPTSITAEEYICYQTTKHANRQTDPLGAILEHIKNNPMSFSNRTIQSNINNTQNTHDEHQPKSDKLERRQEHTQTTINNTGENNNKTQQGENCIKTRYGRTIRKPDRLSYQ